MRRYIRYQPSVVIVDVDRQQILQRELLLGRAPGSSRQSLVVVPQHRKCVIDPEQWVVSRSFELPESRQRASDRGVLAVHGARNCPVDLFAITLYGLRVFGAVEKAVLDGASCSAAGA